MKIFRNFLRIWKNILQKKQVNLLKVLKNTLNCQKNNQINNFCYKIRKI